MRYEGYREWLKYGMGKILGLGAYDKTVFFITSIGKNELAHGGNFLHFSMLNATVIRLHGNFVFVYIRMLSDIRLFSWHIH